ncbi:MAG: hypothetical protein IJQ79_08085 [Bacteroidales bacterium]|nr:hypothetical protein [Bacteroidales bacterium]
MDVRKALLSTVSFPLSAGQVEVIAEDRDLKLDAEYTKKIGKTEGFQLAKADMIRCIITAPNVSEGGVSISIEDRKTLIGIANGIYSKYEPESFIQEAIPTVTPIED